MKLYSLTNMYCIGIQAGIQCQHSTVRLLNKYRDDNEKFFLLNGDERYYKKCVDYIERWYFDEVSVVVNAGDHEELSNIVSMLESEKIVPFAKFEEPGLNNAITSVSIICDDEMIEFMKNYRETPRSSFESGDIVNEMIRKYGSLFTEFLLKLSRMRTSS